MWNSSFRPGWRIKLMASRDALVPERQASGRLFLSEWPALLEWDVDATQQRRGLHVPHLSRTANPHVTCLTGRIKRQEGWIIEYTLTILTYSLTKSV